MSIRQWLLRRLLPPRPEQLSAPTDAEAADLIDRTLAWQGMGRQAAPISCDEALALLTAYREAREDAALAAERDDHPMIVAKIVDGPVTPEAGRNIADAIARMSSGTRSSAGRSLSCRSSAGTVAPASTGSRRACRGGCGRSRSRRSWR